MSKMIKAATVIGTTNGMVNQMKPNKYLSFIAYFFCYLGGSSFNGSLMDSAQSTRNAVNR